MRILSIHTNGTVVGGADIVYIQGNCLLTEHGHSIGWLTIGEVPIASKLNQPVFCLPEFRQNDALKKQIGLAIGHLYNYQARKLAIQALHDFKPDIIHVHTIQGHLSPAVLLPFQQENIPVIQTLHDYRLLCPAIHFLSQGQPCEACKGKKYYHCIRKRCRNNQLVRSGLAALGSYLSDYVYQYDQLISGYIAPSEFMRQKMIGFGYASQKTHLLPNAYFGQVPAPRGAKRGHILFAGRLSQEKGADLLVRAAVNLNMVIIIAGDGPERERLQALARQVGASNVSFPGFLSPIELSRLYQTALVTVLPSRWYENGPLVILESYANATPVVGARIGAIPEFVDDGKTGFLFSPNDADDLHKVLQYCITHSDSAKQMGDSALARVNAKYSPAAYIEGLENIFNKVVKQGSHENRGI
jgi:glycosyltransferase involved in cell wall biosynthesis